MKLLLGVFLAVVGVILVTDACNVSFGKVEFGEQLLHTMPVSVGPVQTPVNMTLVFDYLVSPVDVYLQITRVAIQTTLVGVDLPRCQSVFPSTPALPGGFRAIVTSLDPVTHMFGTAEIYGVRRIN